MASLGGAAGSLIQYIEKKNEDQCFSKEGTSVQTEVVGTSDIITESIEVERINIEVEHKTVRTSGTSESKEGNLDKAENNFKYLSDVSFWNVPLQDGLRVEIIKRGSVFQNKNGPFDTVLRNVGDAKGNFRQLSTDWFHKVMPKGENHLRYLEKWKITEIHLKTNKIRNY